LGSQLLVLEAEVHPKHAWAAIATYRYDDSSSTRRMSAQRNFVRRLGAQAWHGMPFHECSTIMQPGEYA
jgi:hypothetical protein